MKCLEPSRAPDDSGISSDSDISNRNSRYEETSGVLMNKSAENLKFRGRLGCGIDFLRLTAILSIEKISLKTNSHSIYSIFLTKMNLCRLSILESAFIRQTGGFRENSSIKRAQCFSNRMVRTSTISRIIRERISELQITPWVASNARWLDRLPIEQFFHDSKCLEWARRRGENRIAGCSVRSWVTREERKIS